MESTKKTKVFVSCVEYEFAHELTAVERSLRDLGFEIIERESGIGGAIEMFFDLERDYVRRCDLFVGVYGSAYGGFSNKPDENFLEIGYRNAEDLEKPVLAFVQNVRVREERLHALVSRIVTRQGGIRWGDSVTGKVNEGLKISLYVIVVLSKAFIGKHWPNRELSAALNIEASTGKTRVLPLIVGMESEIQEILTEFPLLSDKLYVVWDGTPKATLDALKSRLAMRSSDTIQH